jgi:hypothetical protein
MSRSPKSHVRPHALALDPDVPPDLDGRGTCRCGLIDIPGDLRHTLPTVPEQAEHRRRAGERTGP